MKGKIGILIVLALVVIFIGNIVMKKIDQDTKINAAEQGYEVDFEKEKFSFSKGDLAPDVVMTTLDGKEVHLSDYRGKKVILNFWATWCPPCKAEMPAMQKYYSKLKEKDNVEILAFNLTFSGDSKKNVEQFVASYKLTFPVFTTNDKSVADKFGILVMPSTFFIDEEGRIQFHHRGPVDEKMLNNYMKKLDEEV